VKASKCGNGLFLSFATLNLMRQHVLVLLQAGDHVRVLSGAHAGQRGMVITVNEGVCIMMPDTRQGQLKVFIKDLTEASADSGTGEHWRLADWCMYLSVNL
jgi:transcription elongation factor